MKHDRIIIPKTLPQEKELEIALRPKTLEEFVGQEKLKENLRVFIESAKKRGVALDHCLFSGPPGCGKTTLAHIIAYEFKTNIKVTSGPALEKTGDLAAILTNLQFQDVLFIDEIHRLNHIVEEALYPVMEEFKFDIVVGQGPNAKIVRLPIANFTLVGATTRSGLLSAPFRSRFGIVENLGFYTPEELQQSVMRSAKILSIEIEEQASYEIAKRARGTPRIANRLLSRVRDFAIVKSDGRINLEITISTMKSLGIDEYGLDEMDRKILLTIIEKFNGGPVGIETISVAINEEVDTITDVYEPYLIQAGFLQRTPRGRIATELAYKHLNIKYTKVHPELF
ncbi:MAG: Holliday junction branch migration DNA helicase RuvB [Endomicrobia bacterium]|nr:Holliday junction branch migration DNA helicase RuvB [Endomicrobiia bacterium]